MDMGWPDNMPLSYDNGLGLAASYPRAMSCGLLESYASYPDIDNEVPIRRRRPPQ